MTNEAINWARRQLPGTESATISTLRAEASFRSFYRLQGIEGDSVVLMVSPPDKELNDQFEGLAEIFGTAGIPVPRVLEADRQNGWFLLTDLGAHELAESYGTAQEPAAIEAALATLINLQTVRDAAIPAYTTERFRDELGIFREWFASKLLGRQLPERIDTAFEYLVERMPAQIQCCVHRDYHCRNLLFDPITGKLGVVDFQDALIGPVSYDLASLLHDCYHSFSDQDVAGWRDWYLQHTPLPLEPEKFGEDLTLTAIQRQLKAVGIFARLKLRDDKTTHLSHILPVLASLSRLTSTSVAMAPLADWLMNLDRSDIAARIDQLKQPEKR